VNGTEDRWLWLEEVQGEAALAWVRERSAESRARLEAWPAFADTRRRILDVLDAQDRIPAVVRRRAHLYNFWQDAAQPRGLWRRCTLDEYRKPAPAWELLLDLDALGRAEGENWVWGGALCLGPQYRRCLLRLSRGGADAQVVREFDLVERAFVADGFQLPEAKSELAWADADTLYVGTDFGPRSLTDSGYPRIIKRWRRPPPSTKAGSATSRSACRWIAHPASSARCSATRPTSSAARTSCCAATP
jgi:prolyl oligopeptidase